MEQMTTEIYETLCSKGYKFLMLKDVKRMDSPVLTQCIVQPALTMPSAPVCSCFSIVDGMVKGILSRANMPVHLYIPKSWLATL